MTGANGAVLATIKKVKGLAAEVGGSVIGRLFAKIYSKNLDRAVPLLVEEMNASRV